jgi:DNA-3-methyladenine glycosylase I
VNPDNPLYVAYHDREWGVERALDDDALFELLCLESFQAGLSWETILNKRGAFHRAFRGFRIDAVARMGARDADRLMRNPEIVRNRRKIDAALRNARAARAIRKDRGSFSAFLEPFRPPSRRRGKRTGPVPCDSAESKALARALKKRGFAFVGPVIVYSFLQAIGWVDDHEPGCFLAP